MIKAEVVADSISEEGKRMLTFKVRYPWFIHGEIMTHRVLSRNASSNRAIPLKKMLEEARSDELRAEPVYWGAEQKGMEPGGELSRERTEPFPFGGLDFSPYERTRQEWRIAAFSAAHAAENMGKFGAHKSLCNRLLMPFTHANVIISGTEWNNFFGLRLDKAADPTMRALTIAMWEAKESSSPITMRPGHWHLPFITVRDENIQNWYSNQLLGGSTISSKQFDDILIKVSVARCARVSYESFETGKRSTVEEDLKLYERLVGSQPVHASPAEHQATPDERSYKTDGEDTPYWQNEHQHGNLIGWRQYRKMIPGEDCAPLPDEYLGD